MAKGILQSEVWDVLYANSRDTQARPLRRNHPGGDQLRRLVRPGRQPLPAAPETRAAGPRAARSGGAPCYALHRPEQTLLHRIVEQHYPAFFALLVEQDRPLPGYVYTVSVQTQNAIPTSGEYPWTATATLSFASGGSQTVNASGNALVVARPYSERATEPRK